MPYTINGKNTMLDALGVTHASLNTAFPGDNGANEVAGGSFARQALNFAAASGGSRDSSNQPIFDLPANTSFAFWTGWTALAGGTCRVYGAIGARRMYYSIDAAGNLVRSAAHGLANDDRVVWMGGSPPTGLVEGTVYYVVNATADTFQVSATQGGAAIDITGAAASAILSAVTPQTAGPAGGQFSLSDVDLFL